MSQGGTPAYRSSKDGWSAKTCRVLSLPYSNIALTSGDWVIDPVHGFITKDDIIARRFRQILRNDRKYSA
jgi:hypothetical protein